MKQFKSAEEILGFAIREEEQASAFYASLAKKSTQGFMKKIFEDFSREELGHKAKLEAVRKKGGAGLPSQKVQDLKIGDYLVEAQPSSDMSYQDALILAMKKEKAAFRMYSELAEASADADLRTLMLGLAQEEARHKLRFEVEYDEEILRDN